MIRTRKLKKGEIKQVLIEQLHDYFLPDIRGMVMKGGHLGPFIQYRDGERPHYRDDREVDKFF